MACRNKELAKARQRLYSCQDTIRRTSREKVDDLSSPAARLNPSHFLIDDGNVSGLRVSDFDAVQRRWYVPKKGKNQPCSVDALHLAKDGKWYALEFKNGCVTTENLVRKIHETVMGFIENLGKVADRFRSYSFYRENLVYMVVARDLELQTSSEATFFRLHGYYDRPWTLPDYPIRWSIRPLENVLVNKVYTMPPEMFRRFAKLEKWI